MSHRGPVFLVCVVAVLSGCVAAPVTSAGSISVVGDSGSVATWATTADTTPGGGGATSGATAGSAASVVPGTVVPAAPVTVSTRMPAAATTTRSWITLVSCVYDEATGKTQGTWSYYGASATSAYTATVSGVTYAPMTVGKGAGTGYAKGPGKGSCSATITS